VEAETGEGYPEPGSKLHRVQKMGPVKIRQTMIIAGRGVWRVGGSPARRVTLPHPPASDNVVPKALAGLACKLNFHRICVILYAIQLSCLSLGGICQAYEEQRAARLGHSEERSHENNSRHSEGVHQSRYARPEKRLRLLADTALSSTPGRARTDPPRISSLEIRC